MFRFITHCVRGSPKTMWFGLNRRPWSYQDRKKTSAKSAATECCHWIPCCGGSEYVEVKKKRWGSRPAGEREGEGEREREGQLSQKQGGKRSLEEQTGLCSLYTCLLCESHTWTVRTHICGAQWWGDISSTTAGLFVLFCIKNNNQSFFQYVSVINSKIGRCSDCEVTCRFEKFCESLKSSIFAIVEHLGAYLHNPPFWFFWFLELEWETY